MRCEMESERTIRVDWQRPNQPPVKPTLGPTVIPTVSAPIPFGPYLSEAERFRHIDSSVGSTNTGASRAGLAEVESLGDEEMTRETAIPIHIEPVQLKHTEDEPPQLPLPQAPEEPPRLEPRRRKVSKWPIILGCLLALAFLVIIGIIIAWAVLSGGFQDIRKLTNFNTCSNKECTQIAAELTRSMDEQIPVCENFYRHSCGQFHYENPGNPEAIIDYKTKLDQGVENEINDLLTNPSNISSFSHQFSRALYSQCTDFPLRETLGSEPLISLLRNIPCGPLFPGCNGFNDKSYSWERSSGMIDIYAGDLNVVVLGRDVNPQNPLEIILSFKAPDFSLLADDSRVRIQSLQPQSMSEFQALFGIQLRASIINSSITELLGFKWDKNQQDQLDELIQFILALDELAVTSKQNSELPMLMSLQEFSNMISPIDIKSLFDASLSASHSWSWGDTVLVQNLFYYQNLSLVIANTSKRAIANYLTLATIYNLRPYVQIRGDSEDWRTCLKQISILDPVANVYASNRPFNYIGFSSFFSQLKAFFVSENPQYSPNTLSIIRRMDIKVGAPLRVFEDATLQSIFSSLRIQDDSYEQRKSQNLIPWQSGDTSDYFTSILSAMKFQRNAQMSMIGTFLQPGDSVRWPSLATEFIFNQIENELIAPMGLFQSPPLVIPSTPVPLSSVLGTTGILFYTKLYEIAAILQPETSLNSCTNEIYSQFVPSDTFIPANYSLTASRYSNALRLALRKYRDSTHGAKVKQSLPSLNAYTDEQVMFLQYGALMCSSAGEKVASLHEAMINTAVGYLPEFQSIFRCPSNSAMLPKTACSGLQPAILYPSTMLPPLLF